MPMLVRVAVALVLLAVAGFCAFGFVATYEPPGSPGLGIMYATVGFMGLAGAGWTLFRTARAEPDAAPGRGGR